MRHRLAQGGGDRADWRAYAAALAIPDTAYRTLLGRPVEPGIVEAWRANLPPDPAGTVLRGITDSPEFRDRPGRVVPDPFHPAFAFDRDLIDDRP